LSIIAKRDTLSLDRIVLESILAITFFLALLKLDVPVLRNETDLVALAFEPLHALFAKRNALSVFPILSVRADRYAVALRVNEAFLTNVLADVFRVGLALSTSVIAVFLILVPNVTVFAFVFTLLTIEDLVILAY